MSGWVGHSPERLRTTVGSRAKAPAVVVNLAVANMVNALLQKSHWQRHWSTMTWSGLEEEDARTPVGSKHPSLCDPRGGRK